MCHVIAFSEELLLDVCFENRRVNYGKRRPLRHFIDNGGRAELINISFRASCNKIMWITVVERLLRLKSIRR